MVAALALAIQGCGREEPSRGTTGQSGDRRWQEAVKEAREFRRTPQHKCEEKPLGRFEIGSSEVIVSDPCYPLEPSRSAGSVQGRLGNVKKGTWTAQVLLLDIGASWGTRCAELRAFHADQDAAGPLAWEGQDFSVAVDSGQAGIFEGKHFRDDAIVPADHKWATEPILSDQPWYSLCCEQTLSELGAGVIPFGAVSASGFGDGAYDCFVSRETSGQITAIKIVFIPEEPSEE